MSTIQRRTALLLGACLAAMALAAPVAIADPIMDHPDFPHGDKNPSNWAQAAVADELGAECGASPGVECGFADPANPITLSGVDQGIWWEECDLSLDGHIHSDGSLEVTEAIGQRTGSAPWKTKHCSGLEGGWPGLICVHKPTDEAWVYFEAQWVTGGIGNVSHLFGQIVTGLGGNTEILIDSGDNDTGIHWDTFSDGIDLEPALEITEHEHENPCSWVY